MNSDFPPSVEKIVTDYLDRLSARLKGMPGIDRQELQNEIRSHIYESYRDEEAGDDIERILKVLRRLGEPADVISNRMPRLGRGRKAPLYILAAVLTGLLGVPLGIGAVSILVGLLAGLFALLVGYFGAAVSMVVAGFATSVICGIELIAPGAMDTLNHVFGTEIVHWGPNPEVGATIGLFVSLVVLALGLLMLWGGKYVWRGFRFVTVLSGRNLREVFGRLARLSHRAEKDFVRFRQSAPDGARGVNGVSS